jgi:hypothetical protein
LALGFAQCARATSRLANEDEEPATLSTIELDKVPPGHQGDLAGQEQPEHRKAMREALEPWTFEYEPEHDTIVARGRWALVALSRTQPTRPRSPCRAYLGGLLCSSSQGVGCTA